MDTVHVVPAVQIGPYLIGCSETVVTVHLGVADNALRLSPTCTLISAWARSSSFCRPCSLVSLAWYHATAARPLEPAVIQLNASEPPGLLTSCGLPHRLPSREATT